MISVAKLTQLQSVLLFVEEPKPKIPACESPSPLYASRRYQMDSDLLLSSASSESKSYCESSFWLQDVTLAHWPDGQLHTQAQPGRE